jgi:GNAT superfamily N-acetyltransferase
MSLTVRPLTPDLWLDLEDLFGPHGASNGCWCMYWRIGSAYAKRPREKNKRDFRRVVKNGPPPGLIAFDGDLAVGWCQLTPRADLPRLETGRFTPRVDEKPVWSLSCFYVRRGHRKKGVMAALIKEAIKVAKRAKAPALEVYPVDVRAPTATGNLYTGVASTLERAGFKTVARPAAHRPIMRHDLKRAAR